MLPLNAFVNSNFSLYKYIKLSLSAKKMYTLATGKKVFKKRELNRGVGQNGQSYGIISFGANSFEYNLGYRKG